jgi:hypothetical protein
VKRPPCSQEAESSFYRQAMAVAETLIDVTRCGAANIYTHHRADRNLKL